MMNMKYILSKFKTNSKLDVKEATDILMQFGISHNEKKTRDLIAKGKLVAVSKGTPGDRRSGYLISEKAIYDLVISEIPIMRDIFEHIASENTKKTNAEKKTKKEISAD